MYFVFEYKVSRLITYYKVEEAVQLIALEIYLKASLVYSFSRSLAHNYAVFTKQHGLPHSLVIYLLN